MAVATNRLIASRFFGDEDFEFHDVVWSFRLYIKAGFIGLCHLSDDQGVSDAKLMDLWKQCFVYESEMRRPIEMHGQRIEDPLQFILDRLVESGKVVPFDVGSKKYWWIKGFVKNQKFQDLVFKHPHPPQALVHASLSPEDVIDFEKSLATHRTSHPSRDLDKFLKAYQDSGRTFSDAVLKEVEICRTAAVRKSYEERTETDDNRTTTARKPAATVQEHQLQPSTSTRTLSARSERSNDAHARETNEDGRQNGRTYGTLLDQFWQDNNHGHVASENFHACRDCLTVFIRDWLQVNEDHVLKIIQDAEPEELWEVCRHVALRHKRKPVINLGGYARRAFAKGVKP